MYCYNYSLFPISHTRLHSLNCCTLICLEHSTSLLKDFQNSPGFPELGNTAHLELTSNDMCLSVYSLNTSTGDLLMSLSRLMLPPNCVPDLLLFFTSKNVRSSFKADLKAAFSMRILPNLPKLIYRPSLESITFFMSHHILPCVIAILALLP